MRAKDNKWLLLKEGVVLNNIIEPVIIGLDECFADAKRVGVVTSGVRTAIEQLGIIKSLCVQHGLDKEYPWIVSCSLTDTMMYEGKLVFAWQLPWSKLLNIGVIVNPPVPSRCLLPYRPDGGRERMGTIIGISPHMKGKSFDVRWVKEDDPEPVILQGAWHRGLPGLIFVKPEPKNHAVHCDCTIP